MDDREEKELARDDWGDAMFSNHKKDQPCLGCGAVMISKVQLDEAGHLAVNTLTQIEFQAVEGEMYLKCQKCGANNFVDLDTGKDGLPQLKFTHVKA
jgi:hypothetical protein